MCAHNVKILLMVVHHISLSINYHWQVGDEVMEGFLGQAVTAEEDASTAISEIPHFTLEVPSLSLQVWNHGRTNNMKLR